jgi:hypothetical protein
MEGDDEWMYGAKHASVSARARLIDRNGDFSAAMA